MRKLKKYRGIIIGTIAFITFKLLSFFPDLTHSIYLGGCYSFFKGVLRVIFNWMPFPAMGLVLLLVFLGLLRIIFKPSSWKTKFRRAFNGVGWIIAWFYLFWGFNYAGKGIMSHLDIPITSAVPYNITIESLATDALLERSELKENPLSKQFLNDSIQSEIKLEVDHFFEKVDWPFDDKPRHHILAESGYLRKLGIAGIYMPFTGQCHVDGSYSDVRKAFILAHELTHSYGITNEGESNAIAYVVLKNSSNPFLRYAASIQLLLSISSMDEIKTFDNPLKSDIEWLIEDGKKYQSSVGTISSEFNNAYLQLNNLEEGVDSYSSYLQMIGPLSHKVYLKK